jgi:hypothetical protein
MGLLQSFVRPSKNSNSPQAISQNGNKSALPNSFYEAIITLIPKVHKKNQRELQTYLPYEHWYKNTQ